MKKRRRANPWKAKYEKELARANTIDCNFRMLARQVDAASEAARRLLWDLERSKLKDEPLLMLAVERVRDQVGAAYLTACRGAGA